MGYSNLTIEDYDNDPEFWGGTKHILLPKWARELSDKGFKGVSAVDFYSDIFCDELEPERMPQDYQTGEYGAIALEIVKNPKKKDKKRYIGKRTTITKDLSPLIDLIDRTNNFCMMSPISYAGRNRSISNARYLFAMVIEIDELIEKNNSGLVELLYSWEREVYPLPKPTYIVCSGNGVHLYYVFDRPIPLFKNVFEQLSKARQELIPKLWSRYVSKAPIQYESVAQGFRIVGTCGKNKNVFALAFRVGQKVTIEYMNSFIQNPENKILNFYKSNLSLEEAKSRYPEWYKKRIENKAEKGHFYRHPGIYYDWVKKVELMGQTGHRYNCLEALCALAVQCKIPPEQVEKDCNHLMERLDKLTTSEDNHFTHYDVICALRTYHNADQRAFERNIDIISIKTAIPLKRAKRNGRPQAIHLKRARAVQAIDYENWREGNGRPSKEKIVCDWRSANPEGKKIECHKETGLSRVTIDKWWNCSQAKPSTLG